MTVGDRTVGRLTVEPCDRGQPYGWTVGRLTVEPVGRLDG